MKPNRIFDAAGKSIPVTDIEVSPLTVVQVKTTDHDGYDAIQIGFNFKNSKKWTKPKIGHLKKAGFGTKFLPRFLREIRYAPDPSAEFKINDKIEIDQVFKIGDKVKVTATSKSKGFQGGVKRHGFAGGSRTHGQSDRERAPGSIGQTTTPGHVYKGKRMAGRMGGVDITISGLQVVAIDTEKKMLRLKGLIPGNKEAPVIITKQ